MANLPAGATCSLCKQTSFATRALCDARFAFQRAYMAPITLASGLCAAVGPRADGMSRFQWIPQLRPVMRERGRGFMVWPVV